MLRISHAFTLDKVIRHNFVPAIRYSFVPARLEEQFCTCTAPKLYRYSVKLQGKEHFCIGSQVIRDTQCKRSLNIHGIGSVAVLLKWSLTEPEIWVKCLVRIKKIKEGNWLPNVFLSKRLVERCKYSIILLSQNFRFFEWTWTLTKPENAHMMQC